MEYEGDYFYGQKWNGRGYDKNGNIIYELINGTGKIKEFNDNGNLIFEGEYLNGERNGKGKEYFRGKLIFEGEYLNNWRRRGKDYIKGILEYKGEYLYNNKWNGKGYDEQYNIIYELIKGTGKIKEYNDNGELEFEGEYLNGKRWSKKWKR